jgi:paraquat-inducible protein B
MSKPANKRLIGIFVLGAITLLVIAVVALGSGKLFRTTFSVVCFFYVSVGGLNKGAPVVFNGVRIGEVTDVILRYNTTDLTTSVPVYIEIDPQRVKTLGPHPSPTNFEKDLRLLINRGLKARLELESIVTGKLQVSLGFYPDRTVRLVGADQKYPEIPTIPSTVQEITKRIEQLPLEDIIKDIASAVKGINRIVNSPEITKTVQSVSGAAEEAQGLMKSLKSKTATLTSSVDGTMKDIQKLVQRIDRQVEPLSVSMQRTLSSVEKTSDEAAIALRQAQQTLAVLEGEIGEDSELVYELKKAIKEVGNAGKAVRGLARALDRQPESLLFGKKKKVER